LNPIIKFSTLFGLLAVEIAVKMKEAAHNAERTDFTPIVGAIMFVIALVFVWRSFYAMRIPEKADIKSSGTGGRGEASARQTTAAAH
jgi:K(+)-stimulated pyrophosphate-energized sodium pump